MKLVFAGLGMELIGLILGALFMGQKWDETYKTQGVITVSLLIAVLIGWFVRLLYLLKRLQRDDDSL